MSASEPRNVVLIGYRGCGKSSVGQVLAARLSWRYVDTDALIEHEAGCTVAELFARAGEADFRKREARIVAKVARGARQIISVGGGAVLDAANQAHLKAAGPCVWLTAPPEELHRRLTADTRSATLRPNLTTQGGLAEIREVLNARAPVYNAVADHTVDTTGRTVEQVVDDVLAWMQARWPTTAPRTCPKPD
jgi:shikimate kinase